MRHPRLAALVDTYVDTVLEHSPAWATLLGDPRFDHELGDPSPAAVASTVSRLRTIGRELDTIDAGGLPAEEALEHALLRTELDTKELDLDAIRLWSRNPDTALQAVLDACFGLLLREQQPASERVEALAARLAAVPAYLERARTAVEAAPAVYVEVARGTIASAPGFLGETVLPWVREHAPGRASSVAELADRAGDAFAAAGRWLDELPRAGTFAIGEELLERRLRAAHLLDATPAQLVARGQAIVEETTAELERLAAQRDPSRSWSEQVAELKADHPPATELVDWYREAMTSSRAQVERDGVVPMPVADEELRVVETPAPWRHVIPYAAYLEPPPFLDGRRVGHFWVTPVTPELSPREAADRLEGHCRASVYVTAVHEGYPGHHLQLVWSGAHPSKLRALCDSPMFVEGWAFYCEELFHELGHYDTGTRLWQLKDQVWRGLRVVLDMELHCGERTPDEAVAALVEVAGLEQANAQAEVRRYAYTPTQPMSYAIGKQEFLRLRDRVRASQGASFSARAFHERVLANGTLPLALAERALLAS